MWYFSESRVCNVLKVMTAFALLLTNMPYTQAQTCNLDMTTYTIPSAGNSKRNWGYNWCVPFTAPVDGFLNHMTILTTGDVVSKAAVTGRIQDGGQYRNDVFIALPSQATVDLDKQYITRTRAIQLEFLQGDVFSRTLITPFVSFMYACKYI